MLKVGLIGCGGMMGDRHSTCYELLADKVQVVAVADRVPEVANKVAAKFGARVYDSGMELMDNEEVDYVDICLPTFLHTQHAVYAMEKGFDVFLEKPTCLNEEEAKLLLETQKKTGAIVQIGQCERFNPAIIWLKETLESGKYGKIVNAVFHRLSFNPNWGNGNWFNDYKKSGTVALDLHIHDTDLIRYVFGEPTDLHSFASRDDQGVIQHIFTIFNYGGTVISAEGGWDYEKNFGFSCGYRIQFETATAVYDGKTVQIHLKDGETITQTFNKDVGVSIENTEFNTAEVYEYLVELETFIDHLNKGEEVSKACLKEGVESVRLVWREVEAAGGAKI